MIFDFIFVLVFVFPGSPFPCLLANEMKYLSRVGRYAPWHNDASAVGSRGGRELPPLRGALLARGGAGGPGLERGDLRFHRILATIRKFQGHYKHPCHASAECPSWLWGVT